MTASQRDAQADYEARAESIRQLEGWPRLYETYELARMIDKGEFDSLDVRTSPAGHQEGR